MFRIAHAWERNQGANHWRSAQTGASDQINVKRFKAVALPHLDAAYNLARWLTGNDDDAQCITQKAIARASQLLIQFPDGDARAWLLGIVHDTYYTWLNKIGEPARDEPYKSKHDDRADKDAALSANLPEFGAEPLEMRQISKQSIDQALNGLPVTFREIIVLHELEDLSYRQIAKIADISVDDVMSLLARARELLQTQLIRISAHPPK